MKKIFFAFLMCCTSFACAQGEPIFKESQDSIKPGAYRAFSCPEGREGDLSSLSGEEENEQTQEQVLPRAHAHRSGGLFNSSLSYSRWSLYKADYGVEHIHVRFPQDPTIVRTSTMVSAYAYDGLISYHMNGYFPPTPNIIPSLWFDEILYGNNCYPFVVKAYKTFQADIGVYILDYVAHDIFQNNIIKGRAIATPFNGYILQCVKPNGFNDHFDYFVDNFSIRY